MQRGKLFLACSVVAVLLLPGCTMDVSTVINPDGSGTISVTLSQVAEDVDFIRQMPNMADYLNAWRDSLRKQGVLIDISRRGENEYIFLQNRFDDLDGISTPMDLPGDVKTWIAVTMDSTPFETVYRYAAVVDTTTLYQGSPGMDSRVQAEVVKELNQMQFTYSVILPGEITYTNATRQKANRMIWDIRMNAQNELKAESRLRHDSRVNVVKTITGALAGGVMLSLLLLTYSAVAYRGSTEGLRNRRND